MTFGTPSNVPRLTWSSYQPGAEFVKWLRHTQKTSSEVSKGLDPTDGNKAPKIPAFLFIKGHWKTSLKMLFVFITDFSQKTRSSIQILFTNRYSHTKTVPFSSFPPHKGKKIYISSTYQSLSPIWFLMTGSDLEPYILSWALVRNEAPSSSES